MKSILVPTDFSAHANQAFELALAIAQKAGATLTLLHITDQVTATGNSPAEDKENLGLQQKLETYQQKSNGQIIINTAIVQGSVVPAILQAITTYAADLVVMGTLGATGLKKVIVGSNTANVIGKSPVPVLSIPAGYNKTAIKEIVLAINHTEEDLHNLAPLFELANILQAQVRLAIFTGEKAEAVTYVTDRRGIVRLQEKLKDQYGQTGLAVEHLSGTNFQETIQDFITTNAIDLLAMITYRRGALEGLFNKSITKEMAYHATLPMLCLQGNKM